MKSSRTLTRRNKMRLSLRREQIPVQSSETRAAFFVFTLMPDSRAFLICRKSHKFRDSKSNSLFVGVLGTQKQKKSAKKYFSRNGCGGCSNNQMFCWTDFLFLKSVKNWPKQPFSVQKIKHTFSWTLTLPFGILWLRWYHNPEVCTKFQDYPMQLLPHFAIFEL